MTISVVEIENGYPLERRVDITAQIKKAVSSDKAEWYELPEGNHDVTPRWWRKNNHWHEVMVLNTGEGVYRALPKDREVGLIEQEPDSGKTNYKRGGMQIRLPQDEGLAIIAGPTRDLKGLGILRVIFHWPGPNPKEKTRVSSPI